MDGASSQIIKFGFKDDVVDDSGKEKTKQQIENKNL